MENRPKPPARPASHGPLAGVKVLDLGTMFAGPFTASLLGDFGAEVIKVELPRTGDPVRNIVVVDGVSGAWSILNRNKRCISLDVRHEKGKALLKRLAAWADVVVENFRPGTLEGWGLGYPELKAVNPRLILIRISGYGQTGPHAYKAGFGTPATAFSGLTYLQGYPDRPPVSPPFALVDYLTGLYGAMAGVMALYYLQAHDAGEGQEVDLALYESIFRMLETIVAEYGMTGKVRERFGHIMVESAPSGAFECQDGKWVVIVASTDRTFGRLAEAMGHPEWVTDRRFNTNPNRVRNRDELLALTQAWTRQHPAAELLEILDKEGVPGCPIHSMADIFQDPHYRARENLVEVEHPVLGRITMPGIVPKFSMTPGAIRTAGPVKIGEHNGEVYQGLLGVGDEELRALQAEGVI